MNLSTLSIESCAAMGPCGWSAVAVKLLTGLGGRSVRLVGTTLDITDGKLAHEKLRQSEEKYPVSCH